MFFLSLVLPTILLFANFTLFNKLKSFREKPRPFECGFDPSLLTRNPFSLKFYLIAIVFLIFDIEIALILPTPVVINSSHLAILITSINFFLIVLLLGLF